MKTNARIALLYNFLPPYRIKVFEELQKSVGALRVFLSIPMEKGRQWKPEFGDLDVVIQRTVTTQYISRSPNGFSTELSCHLPLDTFLRLSEFKPDAVLSLEFGMRTLQSALYTLTHRRAKLIIWAHVSEVTELARGRGRWLLRKLLLKAASGVLVNGSSGRRYIESLGFPSDKIHMVPQAIDIAMFRGEPVRKPQETTRLIYVGQLIERKGIIPFLDQLGEWAERNPQRSIILTLLGSGPVKDELLARVLPANLELRIIPHVPYNEVPSYYRDADIFVFPTLADEWGLVVNEAMSAGLPVFGSEYSQAVKELVVPGLNGWRFRTDHAEELYACLDIALNTSAQALDRMRRSAIETIEPLTTRVMASRILEGIAAATQCGVVQRPNAAKEVKKRIALLYNFIPPHRIKVFEELQKSVGALRVFLSIPMEKGRQWKPEFGDLDVVIQRTVTTQYTSHSPKGFSTELSCHFPLDTVKRLMEFQPDVILSLEFGMRTVQAALYTLFHRKTKLVVWAQVSEVTELARGTVRRLLRTTILHFVSGVLVNGRSGRRYIESLGFPSSRVYVVPKTSDIDLFRGEPVRKPQETTRLLYVGQLIERKGIIPFLDQLGEWAARNPERLITYTILGSGPLMDNIQKLTLPANLELRIREHVPYCEVPKYYKEADIFVFPTLADEWGNVVNEAMISGLPVLGSIYSQAVEDLVVTGVNGWVFHTDDAEEMYSCIDLALNTPAQGLDRMRISAIETIEPLTPRFMADRILDGIAAVTQE